VEFHIHHVKEAARVTKIIALLDKTGKPSKSAPRFLKSKQNALIQVINEMDHCEWLSFRLPNDHTFHIPVYCFSCNFFRSH